MRSMSGRWKLSSRRRHINKRKYGVERNDTKMIHDLVDSEIRPKTQRWKEMKYKEPSFRCRDKSTRKAQIEYGISTDSDNARRNQHLLFTKNFPSVNKGFITETRRLLDQARRLHSLSLVWTEAHTK